MPPTLFHQEMYIRDLNLEFDKLESPENVDSAQVATATSHKDYVSGQKSLSKLFRKENDKRAIAVFKKYHEQGEATKSDHEIYLMFIARSNISPYGISAATKPETIHQLNPGPSSGEPMLFVWVLIDL